MLKKHPRGLIVAFFTNMGERFGFYTMMAILVLFLQVKFNLSPTLAGDYYSWFYFSIYALSIFGGLLADWKKHYKTVILYGQIVMFFGYVILAVPNISVGVTLLALLIISLGNGLFKGNLQAVVGQLYDNEKYAKYRDAAYMIFYMGINIGAFFAPFVAIKVRNWWLHFNGFTYDGSLPALCHQYQNGTLKNVEQFREMANEVVVSGSPIIDFGAFAQEYLDVFARGYNWVFGIAATAILISLAVFIIFRKKLPSRSVPTQVEMVSNTIDNKSANTGRTLILSLLAMVVVTFGIYILPFLNDPSEQISKLGLGLAVGLFIAFVTFIFFISSKEEKPSIISLILVFVVVIFFWMSFNQNGLTFTLFARDYTQKQVGAFTNLFFHLESIVCVLATVLGFILIFKSNATLRDRTLGIIITLLFGSISYYFVKNAAPLNNISPEVFQAFNPLFIVSLTPLVVGLFQFLNSKRIDPSTPRKIGYGMLIAVAGFVILLIGSLNVVSPHILDGSPVPDSSRISPYWLISTYFVLTIAEVFLSPMGLSFVSKVAPVRFQGLMQGGWLLATAVGNKLTFIGSTLWERVHLSWLWGILAFSCLLSALLIFAMMKRLETTTRGL